MIQVNTPQSFQTRQQTNFHSGMSQTHRTVRTTEKHAILPRACVEIPVNCVTNGNVAVTSSFQGVDPVCWPAQVCPVIQGKAQYTNQAKDIITCPKYAHFSVHSGGGNVEHYVGTEYPKFGDHSPLSVDKILVQFQINDSELNSDQRNLLDTIHRENIKVFDNDLSEGYNHHMGTYEVSFMFKDSSKPPPLKVWAPNYNKSCQDLLESQGVLQDPMEAEVDILPPSFANHDTAKGSSET